ncbi:hypothetical protein F2P81_021626 [Scophthalmus maximus]|uniref:Uncharacterized protein n=1 Tax=Scophthalmus maximus TaxID=52904 RepID=A0A6A4S301_SCOMX|nr:hypothetical protein F2P81_021626 [Scophthalmus maximus]
MRKRTCVTSSRHPRENQSVRRKSFSGSCKWFHLPTRVYVYVEAAESPTTSEGTLKTSASRAEQSIRVLCEKLHDQREEINDLKKIIKCLRKDIERSRKTKRDVLHPELAVLQAENTQLKIKLNKSKCAETKCKRDLQQLNSNMRDLKNHYITLKRGNMSLEEENMDLEKTIHMMRLQSENERRHTVQEADEPTSRVLRDMMTDQCEAGGLTAGMVEKVMFKRFSSQTKEIHDLKKIIEGFRRDIERSRNRKKCVLRPENAAPRAKNKALEERVDALRTQNKGTCKDVKGLRERNAEVEIMLNQSKYAETEGKTDLKDLKNHNMILKQENASLEQQNRDLEKTLHEMRLRADDERPQNEALRETIQEADGPTGQVLRDTIAKQYEDLQQETKSIARELEELQCKHYAMEQENESMRNRHTALERDLQVFEHNYNATASKCEDLQRKVQNVVQELKVLDHDKDSVSKQHKSLERELDEVEKELSDRLVNFSAIREIENTAQELKRAMAKDTEALERQKARRVQEKVLQWRRIHQMNTGILRAQQ